MTRRILAALAATGFLLIAPARVGAQTPGAPRVALTAQAPTVTLGGDLTYTVQLADAPANAALRTTVFDRITSRSTFERIIDGTVTGRAISRVTTPVTTPTSQAVRVPLAGSATEGPALNVTQTGVYPLQIELLDGGTVAGTPVTTFLITVPADAAPIREPLTVATVVPVIDAPAFDPNGRPEPAALTARGRDGRLGQIAAGLASVPTTPLTVELGGETMQAWSELADRDPAVASTLEQLRASVTNRQRIAGTFVPVNAPALRNAGLETTAQEEFARGVTAAGDALGLRVDPRTVRIDAVDDGTLNLLAARGVDQLVLPPEALRPNPTRFTPARPFLVNASDRQFRTVTTDPAIARTAASAPDPATNAQRFLAGLTLIALEAPSLTRGIVVPLPDDLNAPVAFYTALLTGLAANGYLRPSTIDGLITDVPLDATSAGPLERTLAPTTPGTVNVTRAEMERSANQTAGLGTLVGPDDSRLRRAKDALLIAPTSLWVGAEGQRRARDELAAVDRSLSDAAATIRVPQNRTFQLTGQRDKVPLTFVNDGDQPVDVRLVLSSTRIDFPNGTTQIVRLPARKSTTISIAVAPRTSGTYPFTMMVYTTAGDVRLAKSTLAVNATGVSGVGYVLAAGAGLFLAVWWIHYAWKRRRRPPSPEPTAIPEPAERSA